MLTLIWQVIYVCYTFIYNYSYRIFVCMLQLSFSEVIEGAITAIRIKNFHSKII
jgi:uncharacterized membrane protein